MSAAASWDEEAEYVVVGTGAGGATSGHDLARAGREVVFLEEGPWLTQPDFRPDFFSSLSRLIRDFGGQVSRGRSFFPVVQGRCVGGSTVVNGGIMHRLPREIWESWSRDPGIHAALPWDLLEEAGDSLERDLEVSGNLDAMLPDLPLSRSLDRLGYCYHAMNRLAPRCQGTRRCMAGCPSGAKLSMERSFIPAAVGSGARVIADCRVRRLVIESSRCVGVEGTRRFADRGETRRFRIRAHKAVVVAAGAIHSPLLLARSGLRNRHIGRHFLCHTGTNVVAEYDRPTREIEGPPMGYEVFHPSGAKLGSLQSVPPELILGNVPSVGRDLVEVLGRIERLCLWNSSVRCRAEGSVRPSWSGGPRISMTPARADMEAVRNGVYHLARVLFAAGARVVFPGIHGIPKALQGPGDLAKIETASLDPRAYLLNCTHLFGTCRMASRPADGVVDPSFRSHEVGSLYVVDASVFPTSTGVNPQQSIMTMARHAVRRMLS